MPGYYYMSALCYKAAMKTLYMNVLSYTHSLTLYLNTQNIEFVLNALLECIKLYIVFY